MYRGLGLIFVLGMAARLEAQSSLALDAAATRVSFAGGSGSSVVSLAPSLRWDTPRASVAAQGSWARFGAGLWSAQGRFGGSFYGPAVLGLRLELGGSFAGTARDDGPSTDQWSGATRLHYVGRRVGVWAGGAAGRAFDGTRHQTVTTGEIGVWGRTRTATMAMTITPTAIGDSLRHTDVIGAVRLERGGLDATAFGGWRQWSRPTGAPHASWIGVNLVLWLKPHLAVTAGAGSYPVDWTQALPSGRFVTVGLRIATRRHSARREVGARLLPPGVTPVVPRFQTVHLTGDRWLIRIVAPGATRVEIMGDFTEWKPVALARDTTGRWSTALRLTPGVYRLNLRVDGGPWGVPPGLPVLRDEFSSVVGVLVIE